MVRSDCLSMSIGMQLLIFPPHIPGERLTPIPIRLLERVAKGHRCYQHKVHWSQRQHETADLVRAICPLDCAEAESSKFQRLSDKRVLIKPERSGQGAISQ